MASFAYPFQPNELIGRANFMILPKHSLKLSQKRPILRHVRLTDPTAWNAEVETRLEIKVTKLTDRVGFWDTRFCRR